MESSTNEPTEERTPHTGVRSLAVRDVLQEILCRKIVFLTAVLCGVLGGALLTWVLDPVYEAKVVVSPVAQDGIDNALSGLSSQLGGLAQLAGVDVGSLSSETKTAAFATLASDAFAREFIEVNVLMPVLYADEWDAHAVRWKHPDRAPTVNDAVRFFCKKVRFIVDDRRTELVTLRIEWKDPELAASWANQMIDMVNERLRLEAIRQADESIVILGKEIARTDSIELRELLYRLMQSNISSKTLAIVRRDFAFRVIDPAFASDWDQMKRPRWIPMMTFGAVLGLLLGAAVAILGLVLREEGRSAR